MIKPPTEEFAYATFTQIPHLKYSGDHKFQFPLKVTLRLSLDSRGVFLYTDLMITLARQIQLKLKKFDEVMIKLKTKYLNNPTLYSELHKLDERKEEIQKLVDNSN